MLISRHSAYILIRRCSFSKFCHHQVNRKKSLIMNFFYPFLSCINPIASCVYTVLSCVNSILSCLNSILSSPCKKVAGSVATVHVYNSLTMSTKIQLPVNKMFVVKGILTAPLARHLCVPWKKILLLFQFQSR